jgi:hypothetical protein
MLQNRLMNGRRDRHRDRHMRMRSERCGRVGQAVSK